MVLLDALGWTIFHKFQGQHRQSPSPASPPFHLLYATLLIPVPSSALTKLILLVTTSLGESSRFPCCMLKRSPPAKPPPGSPPSDPTPESPASPAGSLINHILRNNACPSSPNSPFEFPSNTTPFTTTTAQDTALRPLALQLAELLDFPSVMDSVTRLVGSPRVFGLQTNSSLYAQVKRTSETLIDDGANICLTKNLTSWLTLLKLSLYQSWWQSTGRTHTSMIPAFSGYIFRSIYQTRVHIGSSASIAKIRLKQSSPHRQFWHQVTCLPHGRRPGSRTVALDGSTSTATTACALCNWTLTTVPACTTARRTSSQ